MTPQPGQLEALVAIADHGSFEAAARVLHVTPSAISQRVRALESLCGRVLVTRTAPCRPTEAGAAYVRLGRQTRLLYDEVRLETDPEDHVVPLTVVVNADSLATWFRDVLTTAGTWDDTALRLRVEDQAYSAGLLRRGDVVAAVTSDPTPVQGCAVETLGVLRYGAAATPAFVERWRRGRAMDWERMPVVVFNDKDGLQHEVLAARGVSPRVVHQVPTSTDFHEAARRGLGWCLVPEPQLLPDLGAGRLVRLPGRPETTQVDVPLFWQRWRLDSPALTRLTDAVHAAARTHLRGTDRKPPGNLSH
ncbi:LysR family transcriptional regulator ArgP [Nocardioides stalactiti]|uniref:LysR family transcriptional regulator ArgP n=1 Tax=Nocardioides stalactiti TaxID=2755356 RepID=UPI0016028EFB|nr:LysR family transcriptional regulator ArgP [Nocardioides stalactiti]